MPAGRPAAGGIPVVDANFGRGGGASRLWVPAQRVGAGRPATAADHQVGRADFHNILITLSGLTRWSPSPWSPMRATLTACACTSACAGTGENAL